MCASHASSVVGNKHDRTAVRAILPPFSLVASKTQSLKTKDSNVYISRLIQNIVEAFQEPGCGDDDPHAAPVDESMRLASLVFFLFSQFSIPWTACALISKSNSIEFFFLICASMNGRVIVFFFLS